MTTATEARANGTVLVDTLVERLTGLTETLERERQHRTSVRDRITDAAHEAYADHEYDAILDLLQEFGLPMPKTRMTIYKVVMAFVPTPNSGAVTAVGGSSVTIPWGLSYAVVLDQRTVEVEVEIEGGSDECVCDRATFSPYALDGMTGYIDIGRFCYTNCKNAEFRDAASGRHGAISALPGFIPAPPSPQFPFGA